MAKAPRSPVKGTMGLIKDVGGGVSVGALHMDPRRSMAKGRINLKAVAEVLVEHGLDPTVEIIKILNPKHADGTPAPSRLPDDVRARVLSNLLEYCQPKLKSVEISGNVGIERLDITDEQAARIAAEFLKRSQ